MSWLEHAVLWGVNGCMGSPTVWEVMLSDGVGSVRLERVQCAIGL